jgi:hypothetical protein
MKRTAEEKREMDAIGLTYHSEHESWLKPYTAEAAIETADLAQKFGDNRKRDIAEGCQR